MMTLTKVVWRAGGLVAAAGALSGCVGIQILSVPLGPTPSEGLLVKQVIAPTVAGTGCLYAPGGVSLLLGRMAVGSGSDTANEYRAALEVENTLPPNAGEPGRSVQYGGLYGNTDHNHLTIIGAHVRYEYPQGQPQALTVRYANEPLEGTPLAGISTMATGELKTGVTAMSLTTLMNPRVAQELVKDAAVVRGLGRRGGYPVIARAFLEARSGSGGRVTSNEISFEIRLFKREVFQNCSVVDELCRQSGQVAVRALQCFRDQDSPECDAACQ